MLKKTILLLTIFVLSLTIFVLATLPASVLWHRGIAPHVNLKPMQLEVEALNGTIWDGQALLNVRRIPVLLNWQFAWSELQGLAIPLAIQVESGVGNFDVITHLGLNQQTLSLYHLQLDLDALNPELRAQRVTLDGEVFVNDLVLVLAEQKIESATGRLSWSGGDIAYPAGRQIHERTMPSFNVQIETLSPGEVELGVRDSGGRIDVIEADLEPSGVAMLRVRRRLLDIAQEPWSRGNSTEQDVVFKVKQNLYQMMGLNHGN